MKRYYEIVTIFAPNVSEEKMKSDIAKIKDIIKNSNGEVEKEENWGNKKLAYEIKKFQEGIYNFISCSVEKTSFVSELKKFLSSNEEIIRYGIKRIEKKVKKEAVENV